MRTKSYPQTEEKSVIVNESAVAYGNVAREKLSPYTMEEIHKSMDETEADFMAGRVYSHDDVMREMREFILIL